MGLDRLHPMWRYFIYRRIVSELEWRRFRSRCPYYDSRRGWCRKLNALCSFSRCPFRRR